MTENSETTEKMWLITVLGSMIGAIVGIFAPGPFFAWVIVGLVAGRLVDRSIERSTLEPAAPKKAPKATSSSKKGLVFGALSTSAAAAAVVLVALLLVGSSSPPISESDSDPPPPGELTIFSGYGCDLEYVTKHAMLRQGFSEEDFTFEVDWENPVANEAGEAAFGGIATTPEDLVEWLSSSTEETESALSELQETSGSPKQELVDSENWIAIQFEEGSNWEGNQGFVNGQVETFPRESDSGDIMWSFVSPADCREVPVVEEQQLLDDVELASHVGKLSADAVTGQRAGCNNPQRELPTPLKLVTDKVDEPAPAPPAPAPAPPREVPEVTPQPPRVTPMVPKPPPTDEGKNHVLSHVSPDRNHPDERVRPVIPAPDTVIRAPNAPAPPPQPAPNSGGRGDSGHGPTNTTTPPTTQAPAPAPPTTAPPTTNPPPPPPGSF